MPARSLFQFDQKGGWDVDEQIMRFRKEHDCRYCLYYMKICKAVMYCVFDYLPLDSLEEDVVLFILR